MTRRTAATLQMINHLPRMDLRLSATSLIVVACKDVACGCGADVAEQMFSIR